MKEEPIMINYVEKFLGKKSSIQRKIVLVYLFIAVIPITIVTISSSAIYYNNILHKSNDFLEQSARQHEIVVRERIDSYKSILYELITNKEYITLAAQINNGIENTLYVNKSQMENLLQSSVYTYDQVRAITFLADSGEYVTYSKWYDGAAKVIWRNELHRQKIHDLIESKQALSFIATIDLSDMEEKEDHVILIGYPVKDLLSKQQSGVLVIALANDVLLFDNLTADRKQGGISTIILDNKDKIITGSNSAHINGSYRDYLEETFGKSRNLAEKRYKITDTDWTIVHIIDTVDYKGEIDDLTRTVFILMITITCLFFLIVYLVSRKYVRTILYIASEIHNYQGPDENEIELKVDEKDELYLIARQFNKMTARVNILVDTLQQRNEEVRTAAINQKHAEIKALEAQINPHFLYNTLDSINWRAIEHDEEEISVMLGTLGSLLRYSISNIEMTVLLEAEINWLKKYVFLQRDRFQNSFDCTYEITDEALAFPIHKMLLQPIIENTILHAFEDVKADGMIWVTALILWDGRLQINIRDNGCGMEEELLIKIRREITEKSSINSNRIGISNVIHRLRNYYQENQEIIVNSKRGQGSEIILIIPNLLEERIE
jgi:sensor histidine kinase YesM